MREGEISSVDADGSALRRKSVSLEATVASLRREVTGLRRELEQLRRFRDAVWHRAQADIEQWAQREGLALEAPRHPPRSGEVHAALEREERTPATQPIEAASPSAPELRVERRSSTRHPVNCPVRFAVAGGDRTTAATMIDLSHNGLRIRCDTELAAGSRVACGFYLVRGDRQRELVLAKGQVVRNVTAREGGPGFALRIEQITVEPARLVDALVQPLQIAPHATRSDENTLRMGGAIRHAAAVA